MRALLVVLILAFSTAHAARVDIVIPSAGVVQVTDATPPAEGPRIACPPDCTHVTPGPDIDIFDLRVVVPNDPATNDPAWDIVSMDGCRGTSALPADNGKCFLPFSGDVTVSITLRYRPIVALTICPSASIRRRAIRAQVAGTPAAPSRQPEHGAPHTTATGSRSGSRPGRRAARRSSATPGRVPGRDRCASSRSSRTPA
jgi:hypothetical protein